MTQTFNALEIFHRLPFLTLEGQRIFQSAVFFNVFSVCEELQAAVCEGLSHTARENFVEINGELYFNERVLNVIPFMDDTDLFAPVREWLQAQGINASF